jgi:hypothetical protein
LLTEWQTVDARNDRERINKARQNAEDLFKPGQQTIRPDLPTSAPDAAPSAEQPRRQPRIFVIPPQMPMSAAKVESPADQKQKQVRRRAVIRHKAHKIPASQHGRVRALTSYGMTREQVADVYGVTVDEIERIMSRPGHARAA